MNLRQKIKALLEKKQKDLHETEIESEEYLSGIMNDSRLYPETKAAILEIQEESKIIIHAQIHVLQSLLDEPEKI